MRFVVEVAPRFDYGRAGHDVELTSGGALFHSPKLELSLSTRWPLELVDGGDVRARALRAGETATLLERVARLVPLCRFIAPTDPRTRSRTWR